MGSKDESNSKSHNQVVVIMVPFPAQGHLNQLLHMSCLILSHNIPVHYVGTSTHNRQATIRVQGWDQNFISKIHFHHFNVPPFDSPPPNPNSESKFPSHLIPSFEASSHLREHVKELMQSLSPVFKRVVVIHDSLMASVVQDAANIENVENYTFHSTCAFTVFSFFWEKMGKPPLQTSHILQFPSLEGCFIPQIIDFIAAQKEFLKLNDGNIYNTSRAIESTYMELIEKITCSKKHWAVGPFNPLTIEKKDSKGRHSCIEWLDKKEPNSVIYVSFGTTTTLVEEQIQQIAIGLEQSKKNFIWVLRDADKGDIFEGNEVKRHELPKGFEESVKEMGLIVRDWAPQLEILNHPSTGGFTSHCGWNSCLESISMGVPIAAWPMHSDQPRNSVLIAQVLKVGLVVKEWDKRHELVTALDIENVVRRLLETKEGDEMRQKALNLKNDIHKSMDEGGVSRKEMDSFIDHITR
ncbi:zeatin O-glucosyltransferase [Cicer arietinum]|uniref:UDP-glycosyltransferase n=1 Tax=Cicer arietinum TaxID=3827 RepID=A0A067XTY4_CICAR|nr:zeatin O-glucosyltransferase [Cicer arietinum]AGU14112.1 UDP-glycosyltransferase [Cicer arietinum]